MDEVSAEARLADGVETPLGVAVPRAGVEEALQHEGADLILDLVRTNGQREECRITLSLDRQALEALVAQEGEQVLVAISKGQDRPVRPPTSPSRATSRPCRRRSIARGSTACLVQRRPTTPLRRVRCHGQCPPTTRLLMPPR